MAEGAKGAALRKLWLKAYPPQVSPRIDPDVFPSLAALIEDSCRRFADRPAYASMEQLLSYRDLDRRSGEFAAFLRHELKLKRGERVALMMPNLLQYPIALFGVLRAGLTVVNVNPLYTAREVQHQLADSGARAIVVLENMAAVVQEALAGTRVRRVVLTAVGDCLGFPRRQLTNFVVRKLRRAVPGYQLEDAIWFNDALTLGAAHPVPKPKIQGSDLAFLQYTGGTTGVSKGAMLSHRNLVANVLQARPWVGHDAVEGREVILTALPLYHIFALTVNCLVFTLLGGLNVLIANGRDLPGILATWKKHPFTAVTGVNTLYNGLLHTKGFADLDFSALKLAIGGGAAVQKAVADRWQEVTGVTLIEGYGLTEASPAVAMVPPDSQAFTGTIGVPLPSTEVSIRDEDFRALSAGAVGELCVRGPQVMQGYWQRPEETAKVLVRGWLKTGDLACFDERGYLRIVDRKKDMVLVSGFNVYPNEVEEVIAAHPGVLEVAVVGVPDEKSGEAVKAFVVRRDPALDEATLRAHCEKALTGYKRPRFIEFRSELPKSPVGKILRRELRG